MTLSRLDVLVADDGLPNGRSALAAVRALGIAAYRPFVTTAARRTLASASRWCGGVVHVPPRCGPEWIDIVTVALRARGAVVVPASDAAVVGLGLPGSALIDKRVLRTRAQAAGLNVLDQKQYSSITVLRAHAHELSYPVAVKPALPVGPRSHSSHRVDHAGQLPWTMDGPLIVQPFLPGRVTSFDAVVQHGRLVAAVHQRYERTWPVHGGAACAAVTIEPDHELEEKVLQLLGGYDGIVEVELLDGCVIDLNPRVYGSLPLAVKAGANLPALWCAARGGNRRPGPTVRGRPGVWYRWVDADVRSIVQQVGSREMSHTDAWRALAPRRGSAHSVESWQDPAPSAQRLADGARALASRWWSE